MRTISERAGNPASAIKSQYRELMALDCPQTLKQRAGALLAVGGISAKNAAKFRRVLDSEHRLERLQAYLTNFVLAADGLAVL